MHLNVCLIFLASAVKTKGFSLESNQKRGDVALRATSVLASEVSHPREERVMKTVNPLHLSSLESEYLAGVSLKLGKYTTGNLFAYAFVEKLDDSPLRQKARRFATFSTTVPQIMSFVFQRFGKKSVVEEKVKTTITDELTGEIKANMNAAISSRCQKVAFMLLEDLNNIREGLYPLPSDLKLSNQAAPDALSKALTNLADGMNFATTETYVGSAVYNEQSDVSPYARKLSENLDLPNYYVNDFHGVPGGFLAPEHPPIYDLLSETVFTGTHFMSRQMAFRPLALAIEAMGSQNRHGRGLKLLDLGTGNGSFLIQLREAFPALALVGLDLSPAMLKYAEESFRASPVIQKSTAPSIDLVRANMECIPKEDESFDFVTQSNCFHEMPEDAIWNTAAEIARVLKHGGLFVHHDAVQRVDDASVVEVARVSFSARFNEPYILDFMENVDLDKIFAQHGLYPSCPARAYCQAAVRCYLKR